MKIVSSAIAVALCVAATPAVAAVVIDAHPFANNAPDPTPQIHNSGNQTGTSVLGFTNPGNYSFTFTSPTVLKSNGNGHAMVESSNGNGWHTLTLAPTPGPVPPGTVAARGFTAIDFNLNAFNGHNALVDIVLTLFSGGSVTINDVVANNGQNKYLIYGTAGEIFTSIKFTAWKEASNVTAVDLADIRQVDINAVPIPAAPVPEPATWAMMISGFGLIGAGMRRKRTGLATA